MIKEEYVQHDTAKLLKDAGYPQDTRYVRDSVKHLVSPVRPTQAQAMRWLREENRINVRINYFASAEEWFYDILSLATNEYRDSEFYYPTYEAAAEAGIRAACEYLKNNETGRT